MNPLIIYHFIMIFQETISQVQNQNHIHIELAMEKP